MSLDGFEEGTSRQCQVSLIPCLKHGSFTRKHDKNGQNNIIMRAYESMIVLHETDSVVASRGRARHRFDQDGFASCVPTEIYPKPL